MRYCSRHKVNNLYRLALEYRLRKLESLLLEGKRDQEILRDFLGDDYYDKYTSIKKLLSSVYSSSSSFPITLGLMIFCDLPLLSGL